MPFDVLGGDLVVKGTQQRSVHLLLTVSYRKHGSHNSRGMTRKIPAVKTTERMPYSNVPSFVWLGLNSVHGVAEYVAVAY